MTGFVFQGHIHVLFTLLIIYVSRFSVILITTIDRENKRNRNHNYNIIVVVIIIIQLLLLIINAAKNLLNGFMHSDNAVIHVCSDVRPHNLEVIVTTQKQKPDTAFPESSSSHY